MGVQLRVTPETPRTSWYYGIEGFKGDPQLVPQYEGKSEPIGHRMKRIAVRERFLSPAFEAQTTETKAAIAFNSFNRFTFLVDRRSGRTVARSNRMFLHCKLNEI